jgi:hypothetical protein
MTANDPTPELAQPSEDRDTGWSEMNERLKALQDKYAKDRVGDEPRSFATRFRD